MYAVGRLGSYISSPFHPFGGAVDIIVVEQPDGSLKSSPWYVRFGKFQGVLKAKEKVVKINVNGVEADYHMYLDHKGEAFFLREIDDDDVDAEELDSVFYPSSSGEDTDGQFSERRRSMKSKSCNYDAALSGPLPPIDASNGKLLTMTNSRRSRIFGLVFGRKSMEEDSGTREKEEEEEEDGRVVREDSLERAEVAADLLDVNWSTNLASNQHKKESVSNVTGDEPGMNIPSDQSHGLSCMEYTVLHEDRGCNSETSTTSRFSVQKLQSSSSDFGVVNTGHVDGTSNSGEICLQEDLECLTVSEPDELGNINAGCDDSSRVSLSEINISGGESADCPGNKVDQEQEFLDKDKPSHDIGKGVSGEEAGEAFAYGETLESTRIELHDLCEKVEEASYYSCGSGTDIHAKTLSETAELTSEVKSVDKTSLLVTKEKIEISSGLEEENCGNFDAQAIATEETSSSSFGDTIVTERYTQRDTVSSVTGSVQEVESCSISSITGFHNSASEQEGEHMSDEESSSKIHSSSESVAECQDSRNDISATNLNTVSSTKVSDEEQFLFGDLDDLNHVDDESSCLHHETKEHHSSVTPEANQALYPNVETSSPYLVAENTQYEIEGVEKQSRMVSSHINIPRSRNIAGDDIGRMAESLPNIWSPTHEFVSDDFHSLAHSLDTKSPAAKWNPPAEDVSSCTELDPDKEDNTEQPAFEDAEVGANLAAGDQSVIDASSGNWRVWPFSFRRSRSMKKSQPVRSSTKSSYDDSNLESSTGNDSKKDDTEAQVKTKKLRAITPTPQQLSSLNLNEGKNIITFTFSTSMLGQQQVDARIYLWKWDSRVVISDVDGTITKSDVLGQFMPMVGVDWSHTGVTHLFSAIKENGYQLLFLSARSISQAYLTRQFLLNLKQDGKALPDGPVVISPDGLFPSLFREVIRRAPHEFKIACLEDIKAIFPSDRNPFYAGFGNRDTDELSYLKVGIPMGKIFIINPKGEVVVNRRVDSKSYTSLHDLVHDIFPPTCSSEQEDFNDLNFWKLPPGAI